VLQLIARYWDVYLQVPHPFRECFPDILALLGTGLDIVGFIIKGQNEGPMIFTTWVPTIQTCDTLAFGFLSSCRIGGGMIYNVLLSGLGICLKDWLNWSPI
jgi:hypothetical protein